MFKKFFGRLFKRAAPSSADTLTNPLADPTSLTGKDFEFLITPGDIDIPASVFDSLMTPDSFRWTKVIKNNWYYFQVDGDEYMYSRQPPGIQTTFNKDMLYPKAKLI